LGYWSNCVNLAVTDLGFIFFVIVPAHMPMWPGILGPVFWILGALFSTIAVM
jgi:hypothetical protein